WRRRSSSDSRRRRAGSSATWRIASGSCAASTSRRARSGRHPERPTMARSREARPADIEDLRSRLDEAESTIDAIRSGDVDAVVVQGPDGDQVYTLASADRPYRLFFEQMEEGAITLNADGVILASNQRFAAMVGRPVSDLVSRPLKELVHRCDVERVESFLRQRGRQDVRLLTSDGTFVATGFSAREMIVDDLAMLCVVVVDLTARRRAEEADRAVRNQARALVAAQAATFSWDPERGVFEGDENLPKLLGVDADVVSLDGEGGTAGERDAVALLRREIARLADADRALDTELCLEHGTAGERWIQIKAKVFPSDDGGRLVAGAVVDVTKERRLQAEREAALAALRRSDEALREANDRKDEFLAMLGHELRNPLSPIKNAVFILQKSGPADPTLDRARAIIDRQVDHMTRLIDDLLDVSRITQGKIALQRSAVTLSEIVEQAIEITRPLIERRGLGLRVSLECGSDRIECDRARIVQIFENLLTNAAKFTEPGGEIEVRATAGDRELAVTVKDTGIGISGEVAPKVFDLFVQETRSLDRAQGGLGVGLTLVRRIAELHGGRAEVHSDGLGHGSEFTVWLPRAPRAVVEPGT